MSKIRFGHGREDSDSDLDLSTLRPPMGAARGARDNVREVQVHSLGHPEETQAMTLRTLTWSEILAGVAFVLSVASFWNQYFTRGRMMLARPLGVTIMQGQERTHWEPDPLGWSHFWRMSLLLCNTGARHRIVYNVRLVVHHGERVATLPIGQWLKTVKPQDDERSLTAAGGDFARAFAISPRGIFEQACLFKAATTAAPWLQDEGVYQCVLEALVDRRLGQPAWKTLATFTVTLTAQSCAALQEEGSWVHFVTGVAQASKKGGA